MALDWYRVDDRLIHGQVIVGWGQPLNLSFLVLVDDDVAASEWEQELYRMGAPEDIEVFFHTVDDAVRHLAEYRADTRQGMLLTGSIETMVRLAAGDPAITSVSLGGVHHQPGRTQYLRYLFLSGDEVSQLQGLVDRGVVVVAQDVPVARPLPLKEVLESEGAE
jgi:PTS system mannose-specific IIB component/fructoselysine and glucoselysine-specific PTS system IIB component